MGREELLQQKAEREKAMKEISQRCKLPDSIKYDLFNDEGLKAGYVEYFLANDSLVINHQGLLTVKGTVLKSLHEVLGKLLKE